MGPTASSESRAVRILISSPGDVQEERDQLTRVVNELNETIGIVAPEKKISLELIK